MRHTAPLPRVPAAAPERSRGRRRHLLVAAGLVAVAAASALVWSLVRDAQRDPGQAVPVDPLTSGAFRYQVVAGPVTTADCAANSYGAVHDWFTTHPCTRLSRSLYVTETAEVRALVSVAQVTMPTPALAQQLKAITDTDNTGNVSDLVRDGTADLPGAPSVARGEYASRSGGATVTVVEANFFADHRDPALLTRIATDALRLADTLP
ncbi:hypothetical protein SAMN05421810_104315 [Amycolatopsis arida]|uniref:Uncharacterized protein n=1 Tax=Amycolatopsis arida TaxID=587909 RepID=A0A1I5VCT8_9PSEU|nr:hypothetical protein CLV69_106314 [Amycolatopsis arida]SFQ05280.1 hypothetical protein SAMN05421810_104315 [Amycolatopsis arida]